MPQDLFDFYYGSPPAGNDDNEELFHDIIVILYIPPDSGPSGFMAENLLLQPAQSIEDLPS